MSKNLGQIVITTDNWGDLVDRLNDVIEFANTEVISANSTVGITGAELSPVTAHVHGNVSATSIHTSTIAGGNNSTVGALTITSSTTVGNTFTANAVTARGLLHANAGLTVNGQANVTANAEIGGTLTVGPVVSSGDVSGTTATFSGQGSFATVVATGNITGGALAINTTQFVTAASANSIAASANTISLTAVSGLTLSGVTGITGNTSITGTLSVSGNTSVSIITATSNATSNTFTVSPAVVNIAGQVYVASNTNVGIGTLNPSKKLHVIGDVQMTGATNQTGVLTVTANTSIGGALAVTGNVSGANTTFASGTYSGTLGVTGALTLTASASVGTTLTVSGNSSLQNTSVKSLTASNTSTFDGAVSVNNTLNSGNTTVTGFANVSGNIQGGTLTINSIASTGNLTAGTIGAQNTQVTNLTVTANASITGSLSAGSITIPGSGTITAANITASSNVTSNVSVANTSVVGGHVETRGFSNATLGTIGNKVFYAFPMGTFRSGEVLVEFWDGSSQWQSSKLVVVNDGTNAYVTMYGTVSAPASANSSPLLAEVTASINVSSSNVELFANTHVAGVRVKGAATLIRV